MSLNTPGQISPDGSYYWNGQSWVSTLSPDGAHRWDGTSWQPIAPAGPPSGPPTAPAPAWLGMDAPGGGASSASATGPAAIPLTGSRMPLPPGYAAAAAGRRPGGLGWQFGGSAGWSVGFGLASIVAPFAVHIYFPILPIFGLWRAYIALRAGRTVGAIAGFGLNIVGGFVSLLASGLINPPSS